MILGQPLMNWARVARLIPVICFFPIYPQYILASFSKTPWTSAEGTFFEIIAKFPKVMLQTKQANAPVFVNSCISYFAVIYNPALEK